MPRRQKTKKSKPKGKRFGTPSGEKGAKIPKVTPGQFGQGWPDETHTTLKFALRSDAATAATYGLSALAANDVRDPGISFTATNALGFAGYALLYRNFYVLASRIRVRACHGSNTTGIGSTATSTTVVVWPSASGTAANDIQSAQAQPGAKKVTFDIGGAKTISQQCSIPQLQGVSKAQYIADPSVWGSASASPADTNFWNIADESTCAQANLHVILDIEIEYDVVFFRRYSLDLSFERLAMELALKRFKFEEQALAENKQRMESGRGQSIQVKKQDEEKKEDAWEPITPTNTPLVRVVRRPQSLK